MERGTVEQEYTYPEFAQGRPRLNSSGERGSSTPGVIWHTQRVPIVSLGIGLFMTSVPVLAGGPVGPGNNNEGYYLDWRDDVFRASQNTGLDPSISTLVSNALASSDCIEFARTVLNGVSNKKNPVFPANGSLIDVFNAFLAQGANHPLITRNKPSNSWGYGNAVGKIKNGDAAIFSPNGGTTGSDADTVIAELFHLAGKNKYYTDEQLAKAVYNSTYASDADAVIAPEANIFDKQHYQARGWRKDQAYSAYFHYIQMLHCTAVPQPPGHPRRIN